MRVGPALLSIELVPSTCWYSNVRSEVTQAEWQRCRDYVRKRSENRCQVCGGVGPRWPIECHEIWRYDDLTRTQHLDGLVALCPACHEVKHIGLASTKGRLPQTIEHLADVNKWDMETAGAYVEWAFNKWEERSRYDWTLDLAFLATLGIRVPKVMSR